MPVHVSPGVYTTILDYSLYAPNLATTIIGVVGMASKGPLNEAVYISNVVSFINTFGQPDPNYMGPYAALQALRYARQMYYVRVAGSSAAAASCTLNETTVTASVTSTVRGPYSIFSADNNVLKLTVNGQAVSVTLTKGVRTAAQVAADITDALNGGGASNFTVSANANKTISITSTTIGAGGDIAVGTVGSGSTANTALGFPTAGVSSVGVDATPAVLTGSGVNENYTVVEDSNDTLNLIVDGTVVDPIVLTPGTYTAAQAAAVIDGVLANLNPAATCAAVIVGGNHVVQITSGTNGVQSTIQVLGTSNLTDTLGLDLVLHKGAAATSAKVTGSVAGDFTFGKNNYLRVRFNAGNLRNITLPSGVKTADALVSAINTIIGPNGYNEGVASVTLDGKIKIATLVAGSAGSVQVDASGDGQYSANFPTTGVEGTGTPDTPTLTITALTTGTHGNKLKAYVTAGTTQGFKISIYTGDELVEVWDNLLKSPTTDASYVETKINDVSVWITVTDIDTSSLDPAYGVLTEFSGGNDGIDTITDADYIGTVSYTTKTGLQIFANSEAFDLNLLMVPGISSAAVINEMLLICSTRGDCFAIVDPPYGLSFQQVTDWHNGIGAYSDHQAFNTMYGALYHAWLEIYDAVNKQKVWVPPSGLVAGVYAYTDYTADTWWAPAGKNRGRLLQPLRLERSPDLGERDLMYGNQNAVNPIVNFPKDGITVWGQRTLQRKPSALDRVAVVRMVLYLRKVIATAVQYLVFEPNDPQTWAQFINLVEPLLESVKQRRGLEDYRVLCDANTNPPDARERGEMHGVVAMKPVHAVEFLEVKFAVVNLGVKFEDIQF